MKVSKWSTGWGEVLFVTYYLCHDRLCRSSYKILCRNHMERTPRRHTNKGSMKQEDILATRLENEDCGHEVSNSLIENPNFCAFTENPLLVYRLVLIRLAVIYILLYWDTCGFTCMFVRCSWTVQLHWDNKYIIEKSSTKCHKKVLQYHFFIVTADKCFYFMLLFCRVMIDLLFKLWWFCFDGLCYH